MLLTAHRSTWCGTGNYWCYWEFGAGAGPVPWNQQSSGKAQWFPSALEQLSAVAGFRVIKGCFPGRAGSSVAWARKRNCGTYFSFQDVFLQSNTWV